MAWRSLNAELLSPRRMLEIPRKVLDSGSWKTSGNGVGRVTVQGAPEQLVLMTSMCTPELGRACQAFAGVVIHSQLPSRTKQCSEDNPLSSHSAKVLILLVEMVPS